MKFRDRVAHLLSCSLLLWRRRGGLLIGGMALATLVALAWYLLSGTASIRREVAAPPMLMLPPPPPPPPEPEKLPDPPPEKMQPVIEDIKPSPVDEAKDDTPTPSKDSDPITINGDAQAGTDVFGIGAGKGGGSSVGGLGGSSYARYVSSVLQQGLARDPRTRQLAFDDIRVDVWLGADGKVTRLQLVQGTGNARTDEAVLAMVRDLDQIDERPPASVRFPMRVSMKGRRP